MELKEFCVDRLFYDTKNLVVVESDKKELRNELSSYYQKYGKFINMPPEICDRVHKLFLLLEKLDRIVKWELKIMIMTL